MKRFVTAALFAAAMAVPAMADNQAAANEKCTVKSIETVNARLPPSVPARDKQLMIDMGTYQCGCMTTKLAELGDDGQKALHVMAFQPDEGWALWDPNRAFTMLVEEYGLSEEEATAVTNRVSSKMEEIFPACVTEAQQKLLEQMQPK